MPSSTRRRWLCLLGSLGLSGLAGCLDAVGQGLRGRGDTPTHPETSTPSPAVKTWARQATPTPPTRAEGASVTTERTIVDEPGYKDDQFEYLPETNTVRYVAGTSLAGITEFETTSFEAWARREAASIGFQYAEQVTETRLWADGLNSGVGRPPGADTTTEELAIKLEMLKVVDRDGNVSEWPPVRFSELVATAPRTVDVTVTIAGNTYTDTFPVYVRYYEAQYR